MSTMAFTRLRELVVEGVESSLTDRQMFWKQALGKQPLRGKELPARTVSGLGTRKAGRAPEEEAGPRSGLVCWSGGLGRACAICMARRRVSAGKLLVLLPPRHRHCSVGRLAVAEAPGTPAAATAASAASAAAGAAIPAAAVPGGCYYRGCGGRRRGRSLSAAERRTIEQKLRGRRPGRGFSRGRSGMGTGSH